MKEHNISINDQESNQIPCQSIKNNNLKVMSKVIENYQSYDQSKYYSYYLMLDALADESCCTVRKHHRSLFDQYWTSFYCKKAMNTETDLTQIRFV